MSNLSIIEKAKKELNEKLLSKGLSYKKINATVDFFIKILIEECKLNSSVLFKDEKSILLMGRFFDNLASSLDYANNGKIIDCANNLREGFENLTTVFCINHGDGFNLNIKTWPGESRDLVIANATGIFGEIDFDRFKSWNNCKEVHEFKFFYEYISKIIHPTTLKIYALKLEENTKLIKYFANVFKDNILYVIMIFLIYILEKDKLPIDGIYFYDYLIIAVKYCVFINLIYYCGMASKKELNKLEILFAYNEDKDFLENVQFNAKKSKKAIDEFYKIKPFEKIDLKNIEKMLKEKGYYEFFKEDVSKILKNKVTVNYQ